MNLEKYISSKIEAEKRFTWNGIEIFIKDEIHPDRDYAILLVSKK